MMSNKGIRSSLHSENHKSSNAIHNAHDFKNDPLYPLLFDPQTSGGLVFSIGDEELESCLSMLRSHGYKQAACIGTVKPYVSGSSPLKIL